MPTQTPVEQVEQLIEKKLQQAGQLPSSPDDNESGDDPDKVYKDTPSTETFVTTYYTFPDNYHQLEFESIFTDKCLCINAV